MNTKIIFPAIIGVIVLAVALIAYPAFLGSTTLTLSLTSADLDAFAECLSEKGVIMAGTDWCHFCQNQKALFGKSFEYINYKNCELETEWCISNNIGGYPTWIFPGNKRYSGVQQLSTLSNLSGCKI